MKSIFLTINIIIFLSTLIAAQENDELIAFGKPFYKHAWEMDWEYYDAMKTMNNEIKNDEQNKLGLTYKSIIGKKMVVEYDLFTADVVVNSDSQLIWRNSKRKEFENETTHTVHLDDHKTIKSWLEDDNTFITMYADFKTGDSHAILLKSTGEIEQATGSIKIKD
jgi:hypothetical protein